MRLHRFYIQELVGTNKQVTIISVDTVNQIKNVFRLKKGDAVIIFDGSGSDYECVIENIERDTVILNAVKVLESRYMPKREIYLYAAVVKKDNFEWIVEKATELGVTKIIPILSERSEKKSLNESRLKKIAIEASEQSGRGNIPGISEIEGFEKSLEEVAGEKFQIVAFHTEGQSLNKSDINNTKSIAIFIGPEGGWSEREVELFHKNKIPVICLGSQVLRAETAVIAALSRFVF